MKEKINLFSLSPEKMAVTKGGLNGCTCACHYASCGGSSTNNNGDANNSSGLQSGGSGCY